MTKLCSNLSLIYSGRKIQMTCANLDSGARISASAFINFHEDNMSIEIGTI
jgi:hypothetical protein